MRHHRFARGLFTLGLALAAAIACLGPVAAAMAQQPSHDPVVRLRRDLRDSLGAEALAVHDKALTSIGDLRRALDLTEWGTENSAFRKKLGDRFRTQLRAALTSDKPTTRLAAATVVSEIGTTSSASGGQSPISLIRTLVPEFVKLARDADPRVRAAAARALGMLNAGPTETWTYKDKKATIEIVPSKALPAVAPLLGSKDVAERRAAAAALLGLVREAGQFTRGGTSGQQVETTKIELLAAGTEVAPLASRGLDDPDPVVRRLCLETILQSITDLELVLVLPARVGESLPSRLFLPAEVRELPEDQQDRIKKEIRATAAKATSDALDALLKTHGASGHAVVAHLRDSDTAVRLLARQALEEMARVHASLRRRATQKPVPVARAFTPTGQEIAKSAPRLLRERLLPVALQVAQEAQDPIGKVLDKAVTALAVGAKLADPDVAVRLASIDLLERLGEDAAPAAPALIERLAKENEPNRFVRWAAARALGKTLSRADRSLDQQKATPALARLLSDPDADVRLTAASTLESYGPGAGLAVDALVTVLKSGDAVIHKAAINVLVSIGAASRPALPALVTGLSDPDATIRQATAEGLGKLAQASDRTVVDGLRKALADESAEVRRAAGEALINVLLQE